MNTLHVFNTKLKCFKITDQNSGRQLFRESGTESPRLLSTQSSYVRLRFTSDGIVVESGFLIAYFSKNTNRTHVATYHGDGQCWRCYNALISSNARNYHKMYTVLYVRGYFCDVDESNFIEFYWLIFFLLFQVTTRPEVVLQHVAQSVGNVCHLADNASPNRDHHTLNLLS